MRAALSRRWDRRTLRQSLKCQKAKILHPRKGLKFRMIILIFSLIFKGYSF